MRGALFLLTAISSVLFGFVLVPPMRAIAFVHHAGYFFILVAAICFVAAIARCWASPGGKPEWTPADWRLAGVSLAVAVVWQVLEPHGFKVLMDELVLGMTSMSMHFDREAFAPLKTHEVDGLYLVLGGVLDKRPLFFPFLVSILHDVTGYRAENSFVLNGLVSFVLLVLVGRLGRRLGQSENAGCLAVLLLAGLPLLAQTATGGGFDLLNLAMICAVMLLAWRFLEQKTEPAQDALVLGAVLLAQTRYESVLFVGAVGVVLIWAWVQLRRPIISWGLIAAPLLMVTLPLQRKLFTVNPGYWNTKDTGAAPFSWSFFHDNVGHAMNFLFTVDGFQSGSPVLAVSGIVCTTFAIVFLIRRWRLTGRDAGLAVLAVFSAAILVSFALVLCYNWGQLDDFVATRLGLPVLLLFALCAAFAIGRWTTHRRAWVAVLGVPLLWAWCGAIPAAARAQATRSFLSFQEVEWERQFVRDHRNERAFYLMRSPLPAIIERASAVAVNVVAERAEEIDFHVREKSYRDIFVFQRMVLDPTTHEWRADELSQLGPEFVLEEIEQRRFKPLYALRLSRLAKIDLSLQAPRPPDWKPKFPPFTIQADTAETPDGAYVREFLSKLP